MSILNLLARSADQRKVYQCCGAGWPLELNDRSAAPHQVARRLRSRSGTLLSLSRERLIRVILDTVGTVPLHAPACVFIRLDRVAHVCDLLNGSGLHPALGFAVTPRPTPVVGLIGVVDGVIRAVPRAAPFPCIRRLQVGKQCIMCRPVTRRIRRHL